MRRLTVLSSSQQGFLQQRAQFIADVRSQLLELLYRWSALRAGCDSCADGASLHPLLAITQAVSKEQMNAQRCKYMV
jgi:hypothetical protein